MHKIDFKEVLLRIIKYKY